MSYKDSINILKTDYAGGPRSNYQNCKELLGRIKTENLEGPARMRPTELSEQLENQNVQFTQSLNPFFQNRDVVLSRLKKLNLIFWIVTIGLVLIGLIMFSVNFHTAVVLLLAGVASFFIFRKIKDSKADAAAGEHMMFFNQWSNTFGNAETLHSPANGTYAEIDEVYLSSLDSTERGFEMQRRDHKKQMDAMQEQHQQAMAMQQRVIDLQQQQINELAAQGEDISKTIRRGY